MIDREKFLGYTTPSTTVEIEKGQLAFFAKATGEVNPVYSDRSAAHAAGMRDIPAPPTFGFILYAMARELAGPEANFLDSMGVNIGYVLHAEQEFEYFCPMYAGDSITLTGKIAEIYDKKNGALEFVVYVTDAVNQDGELCVRLSNTLVIRNPEAGI